MKAIVLLAAAKLGQTFVRRQSGISITGADIGQGVQQFVAIAEEEEPHGRPCAPYAVLLREFENGWNSFARSDDASALAPIRFGRLHPPALFKIKGDDETRLHRLALQLKFYRGCGT